MPASLRVEPLCELKEKSSFASKSELAIKAKRWKRRSISATIKWPIPSNKRSLLQPLVYRPLLVYKSLLFHKPILVYRPAPGKSKVIRISTLCKPMPSPNSRLSPPGPSDTLCTPWKTTLLRREQSNHRITILAMTWRARLLLCPPPTTWEPHHRGQCL